MLGFRAHRIQFVLGLLLAAMVVLCPSTSMGQTRKSKLQSSNELAKLREEFIKATNDYKASLAKLLAIYERNVKTAEERLNQSRKLQEEGLISRNQVAETEAALTAANEKVTEARTQLAKADTQIASTLLEAEAEAQLTKSPLRRGGLVRTTSYVRYAGSGGWSLSEAWKIQRFFTDSFNKQLPVAVFGQGMIHDRWRLDHRNALDVSLHPDSPEGQALMNHLRARSIPFLAFRSAIPGTATGPHIHIGRPSHRY